MWPSTNVPYPLAAMTYVILYWCGKRADGTEVHFQMGGKSYVGKRETHNDTPRGPRNYPHPGVDLYDEIPPPAFSPSD